MKNIGIFIEHDIVIRHFIRSGVLSGLESVFTVHYVFPRNLKNRVRTDVEELWLHNVHLVDIEVDRISRVRKLCRLKEMRNIGNWVGADKKVCEVSIDIYSDGEEDIFLHYSNRINTSTHFTRVSRN